RRWRPPRTNPFRRWMDERCETLSMRDTRVRTPEPRDRMGGKTSRDYAAVASSEQEELRVVFPRLLLHVRARSRAALQESVKNGARKLCYGVIVVGRHSQDHVRSGIDAIRNAC